MGQVDGGPVGPSALAEDAAEPDQADPEQCLARQGVAGRADLGGQVGVVGQSSRAVVGAEHMAGGEAEDGQRERRDQELGRGRDIGRGAQGAERGPDDPADRPEPVHPGHDRLPGAPLDPDRVRVHRDVAGSCRRAEDEQDRGQHDGVRDEGGQDQGQCPRGQQHPHPGAPAEPVHQYAGARHRHQRTDGRGDHRGAQDAGTGVDVRGDPGQPAGIGAGDDAVHREDEADGSAGAVARGRRRGGRGILVDARLTVWLEYGFCGVDVRGFGHDGAPHPQCGSARSDGAAGRADVGPRDQIIRKGS